MVLSHPLSLFSMYFTSSPLSFSLQFSPLIQRNLLILHLRSFLLPLSLLWTPLLKDNDTDKGHLLTLSNLAQRKNVFPMFFTFLWSLVYPGACFFPMAGSTPECSSGALSFIKLVCADYLLASVKDTYETCYTGRSCTMRCGQPCLDPLSVRRTSDVHFQQEWAIHPISLSCTLGLMTNGQHLPEDLLNSGTRKVLRLQPQKRTDWLNWSLHLGPWLH